MLSTMLMIFMTIGLAAYLFYIVLIRNNRCHGISGPKGVPILGNALQLPASKPHIHLAEWGKQYGHMYQLNLAGSTTIVLCGYSEVYEALVTKGKEFAGRPDSMRCNQFSDNFDFSDLSDKVMFFRKSLINHVKSYESGVAKIEALTIKVMKEYIEKVRQMQSNPVDFISSIGHSVTAMVHVIALEQNIQEKRDAEDIQKICDEFIDIFTPGGAGELLDMFPWLRYFGYSSWRQIRYVRKQMNEQYLKWKDDTIAIEKKGHDMMASFLYKMMKAAQSNIYLGISENEVEQAVWLLLIAGIDTARSIFCCMINFLAHHPEIQRKLRKEAEQVLGSRDPTFEDRDTLHYHQAFMYEAFRYYSVGAVPLHKTMCDTSIAGRSIPKDVRVLIHLWAVCHDDQLWDEPFQFKPQRYLDDNGCLVPADHPARIHNLAFSAGPRGCPGTVFAKTRVLIMLVMLIREFEILPASTIEEQPSCDCRALKSGLVLSPEDFQVKLLSHNKGT